MKLIRPGGRLRAGLDNLIRGVQGNFDHLSGQQKQFARIFNKLADDVAQLYALLGVEYEDSNEESGTPIAASRRLKDEIQDLDDVSETASDDAANLDVLTWDDTNGWWEPSSLGGVGGAPSTADYLTGTSQGGLSAEIVVGTSPGGELGGTWASPTVAATHSGSAHTDFVAKATFDAKGDIISASADNTPSVVTVGANDTILMADSAQTAGLKWVASATPSAVTPDASAAPGTSDDFSRASHQHGVATYSSTPGTVAAAGAAGTSGADPSRGDHVHPHGSGYAGGHTDTAAAFDDATSNPLAVSTSTSDGVENSPARKDHVHPHETAHVAHDTIWAAANDYVRGTGNDTAAVQTASAATPAAVSTSGSTGTAANPPSADDHVHAHEAAHINHDTTWAAKGDLIVGTANDAAAVVSIGSTDDVLTVSGGTAVWAAPTGGGSSTGGDLYLVRSYF